MFGLIFTKMCPYTRCFFGWWIIFENRLLLFHQFNRDCFGYWVHIKITFASSLLLSPRLEQPAKNVLWWRFPLQVFRALIPSFYESMFTSVLQFLLLCLILCFPSTHGTHPHNYTYAFFLYVDALWAQLSFKRILPWSKNKK